MLCIDVKIQASSPLLLITYVSLKDVRHTHPMKTVAFFHPGESDIVEDVPHTPYIKSAVNGDGNFTHH